MAITKDIPFIPVASRFRRARRLEALALLNLDRLAARYWGD
jgi:hypothetical protein